MDILEYKHLLRQDKIEFDKFLSSVLINLFEALKEKNEAKLCIDTIDIGQPKENIIYNFQITSVKKEHIEISFLIFRDSVSIYFGESGYPFYEDWSIKTKKDRYKFISILAELFTSVIYEKIIYCKKKKNKIGHTYNFYANNKLIKTYHQKPFLHFGEKFYIENNYSPWLDNLPDE